MRVKWRGGMRVKRITVVFLTGLLAAGPLALEGQDGIRRVTLAAALEAFAANSLATAGWIRRRADPFWRVDGLAYVLGSAGLVQDVA